MKNQEIQFYLAVDDNSERFFIAKKNEKVLYFIIEKTGSVIMINNTPNNNLRIVGECFDGENEMCNRLINEYEEEK